MGHKLSAIVSGSTFTTGLATFFEKLPVVLGAVASLAGIILTCVIIYDRISIGILKRRKLRLENTILDDRVRRGKPRKV